MREKARIKRILNLLEKYWEQHQDYRFGQMLINIGIADDSLRVWNNQDEGIEELLTKLNQGEKENE